jgi:hypothetical protein
VPTKDSLRRNALMMVIIEDDTMNPVDRTFRQAFAYLRLSYFITLVIGKLSNDRSYAFVNF